MMTRTRPIPSESVTFAVSYTIPPDTSATHMSTHTKAPPQQMTARHPTTIPPMTPTHSSLQPPTNSPNPPSITQTLPSLTTNHPHPHHNSHLQQHPTDPAHRPQIQTIHHHHPHHHHRPRHHHDLPHHHPRRHPPHRTNESRRHTTPHHHHRPRHHHDLPHHHPRHHPPHRTNKSQRHTTPQTTRQAVTARSMQTHHAPTKAETPQTHLTVC